MSLNVSGSKYIKVYDPTIRLNYSDKEVQERAFSRWEARFVGNAFEPSKFLRDGDSIDIVTGWVTSEKFVGKDGNPHYKVIVTISDFQPSAISESEES